MTKLSALSVAAAVAGALAFTTATTAPVFAQGKFKCYGVSKKGQNDCANAAGTHSCAGQAKADYEGGEWKGVADAKACADMGGKDKPFAGMNPNPPKS